MRVSGASPRQFCADMSLNIVQVALDLPLEKNFDFFAPDATTGDVGRLAVVPFGNKLLTGVIVGVSALTEVAHDKLKPVRLIQRALPKFSADDFALIRFCQSYYHHPFGPIALNGLPPAMRATRLVAPKQDRVINITDAGRAALASMPGRAIAQRAMLEAVALAPQAVEMLRSRHPRAAGILRILLDTHWVASHELAAGQPSPADAASAPILVAGPALNHEQAAAVAAITDRLDGFAPFLLTGITGSG